MKHTTQQREILLVDALEQAAVILDEQGRIQHANPVACSSLGLPLEALFQQQLLDHFALNEQNNQTQGICLKPIDNGLLKTASICAKSVRKISLPSENGQTQLAILWCPATSNLHTRDQGTGLPDRNMLLQQLAPLLQSDFSSSHTLIKLQIAANDSSKLEHVDTEQRESLMSDLAAILAPNVRQRDLLARAGDDCFVVLLRGCDLAHAKNIFLKLISEIHAYHEDYPDTHLPPWRVCAGVIPLTSGKTTEETCEEARKACQQACANAHGFSMQSGGDWENLD